MKVFLCNPPWWGDSYRGVRAGSRWPHHQPKTPGGYTPFPFFLAYAAAVLERAGANIFLFDAVGERTSDDDFMGIVKAHQPDVVVIETSTPSIDVDLGCAQRLKAQHLNAKIVFCGTHADTFAPAFLEQHKDVDFIIRGEYEYTLRALISALGNGTPLDDVAGILFRSKVSATFGKVVFTGNRPLVEDINDFPWPARHFLPMRAYGGDSLGGMPLPCATVWASRGCPYGCSFCVWPQLMYGGTTYRVRNPIDVVDEVEHLVTKDGFKSIFFDDDTFNISKEHVLAVCTELKRRNLGIPFAIMARADTMDEEMLVAMKGAGLHALKYGIESASQQIVNDCGKALDLKKAKQIVRRTKELGIVVHLTFMFGLPGETHQTIQETIDLARELQPNSAQFAIATPWPGTRFHQQVVQSGDLVSDNYADYSGSGGAVVKTQALSKDDIVAAAVRARGSWRQPSERMKTEE